jgi:hypothetical protein
MHATYCPAHSISRAFLAAADSDAVWSRASCPGRDLPRFVDAAERSLVALPSYKARFMRLSDDQGRVTVRTFGFGRSKAASI